MSKKDKVKKAKEEVRQTAQNIWLAGLGALATAEEEGGKLFKKLVARGEEFEARNRDQVKEQFQEGVGKAKDMADKAWQGVSAGLDEKVTQVLHRVGVPTRDEIQALTRRVEELTHKVDKIKPQPAKPAAKAPAKASTAKTSTAKPAAKAAAEPAAAGEGNAS